MKTNTISVAICTYNGEKYIQAQLETILNQRCVVDEIVLCDDNSSDRTVEIARQVLEGSDVRWRIERNCPGLGVTKNFEKAISLCSGDIIFTSDQDDLWMLDKTEKLMGCFEEPGCVLAFSDAQIVDGNGQLLLPSLHRKDGFMQLGDFTDNVLRLSYTVYGCTMAFRRDFVRKIIPFFQSRANHDAWIMCCAGFAGTVTYVPEALICYRIHGNNCVGSVAGNPKWDAVAARQDDFDRYFALQELRSLRIELLKEARKRTGGTENAFSRSAEAAIRFYDYLRYAKENPRMGILRLLWSVINGSYRFRFCDRGLRITALKMAKQLPHDIRYLIKWRKQLQ